MADIKGIAKVDLRRDGRLFDDRLFDDRLLDGRLRAIVVEWISDASGDVEHRIDAEIDGMVRALRTIPTTGEQQPALNYDLTWEDEFGVDLLDGAGADQGAASADYIRIGLSQDEPALVRTRWSVFKVANAGAAKRGTAILYLL